MLFNGRFPIRKGLLVRWALPFRWAVVSLVALGAMPATAQVADTTAADTNAADTTAADMDAADAAPADTAVAAPPAADTVLAGDRVPVGFPPVWTGIAMTDSLPVLLPALDLADLVADEPQSFTYRFDTPGWPDGWSYRGLPPHAAGLTLDDLPFTHLFTGRPAFNLVPLALIEPPEERPGPFGRPRAVAARLRSLATPVPATEAKYWRGGDGLQSIDALHAQHRRRPLFGNSGFLNLLGAYSGRAANGEYPGSRLRRARQVLLRARYEQRDWSVELSNLHNRRNVGAHGGVIPEPGNFESIYIRPGATVVNPEAQRRVVRNDLSASLRARFVRLPTTASVFWTAETFRYRSFADTLGTRSDRTGVQVAQPILQSSRHGLIVAFTAWHDEIEPQYGFAHAGVSRTHVQAAIQDTLAFAGWRASLDVGVIGVGGSVRPIAAGSLSRQWGSLRMHTSAALSERNADLVSQTGFGSMSGFASGMAAPPADRIVQGGATIGLDLGSIDVELGGFGSRRARPTDYFAVGDDSAAVRTAGSPLELLGAYAVLRWRRDAQRGLYAAIRSTLLRIPSSDDLQIRRIADTLPSYSGSGRLGARFVLFQGDLDLDTYAEATAWSSMRSRSLHPETALLTVPERDAVIVGPSSILSLAAEAGIRGATLFLVYENALSGTTLMTGNLIVPVYPLPERRFRFGVYWPIFG